ncbi:MAG: hypothetical protein PHT80_12505, partial [Lentisphaeria bacterium]|nr:hypothetical protein [Lentisphaeria bacterium]
MHYPADHNTAPPTPPTGNAPRIIHALASYLPDDFPPPPPAPASATAAHATGPLTGRVHSIFTHAINISVGDTLLTLCDDPSAGIPDSVVIAPADFARLQLQCDAQVRITRDQLLFTPSPDTATPPTTLLALTGPNPANRFPSTVHLAPPALQRERLDAIDATFLDGHRLPAGAEERFP